MPLFCLLLLLLLLLLHSWAEFSSSVAAISGLLPFEWYLSPFTARFISGSLPLASLSIALLLFVAASSAPIPGCLLPSLLGTVSVARTFVIALLFIALFRVSSFFLITIYRFICNIPDFP